MAPETVVVWPCDTSIRSASDDTTDFHSVGSVSPAGEKSAAEVARIYVLCGDR